MQNKLNFPKKKGASHLEFINLKIDYETLSNLTKELIKLLENLDHKNDDIIENLIKDLKKNKYQKYINLDENEFSLTPHEIHYLLMAPKENWLDFIIHRYKFKLFPTKKILSEFPVHVAIEPTSICNLRCIMCFQCDETFGKNKKFMGYMKWDLFKKIIDEVAENKCQAVTFASRGEPTLHKEFTEMLKYCHKKNIIDMKVNTNATQLNDKLINSILSSNVTTVVLSVDATDKETYEKIRVKGKWEKVLANIIRFNEIRKADFPNSITQTRISGVAVQEAQSPNEMEKFWSKYVDYVSIRREIPRWDSYNNTPNDLEGVCNLLYERVYVWFDGTTVPCDFDYKSYLNLGNAQHQSIKQIWHGEKYQKLRMEHNTRNRKKVEPCRRCPFGVEAC